ncbi:MAG: serine/threonine-protein kinase [Methylococcales bacterium]
MPGQKNDQTFLQPVESLHAGIILKSRFVLETVLGEGGMGTIYKARDLRKEEMQDRKPFVAIKVLKENLQNNSALLHALQREARKSQELAHPNIVNVHDFDRDENRVFMVMEYLEGATLSEVIKQNGLQGNPLEERWRIIESIARGLAYAHQRKVVHYDIKPGNIFICNDGNVKILDFGIAKAMRSPADEDQTVFDEYSPSALTPSYASPEMLCQEPPDLRDDIYAFGCVSYQILTGHHPFNKVSALEAMRNNLKPPGIEGISTRRLNALRATLNFKRDDRMPAITAFLDQAQGSRAGRTKSALSKRSIVGVVSITILILGLAGYFGSSLLPPSVFSKSTTPNRPITSIKRPILSDEEQERLNRLLDVADLHYAVGRVLEPVGSSAVDAYQRVLEVDPGEPTALEGLKKAAAYCEENADLHWQEGRPEEAVALLEKCLVFAPRRESMIELKDKIGAGIEKP